MRKMIWQIVIVLLALGAIAILLISQQPTLLPIAPGIQPATGGIYTEGIIGTFGRLNPVLDFVNPADQDIDRLIYSSLVRFDDRGLPVNDLVESMGISQDGNNYNISLRENAEWHDGRPVTSEDVVFTIELLRMEDLPIPQDIRALWQTVEVNALDEHTLQIRLPEPFAPFVDYLTFGILPEHLLGGLSAQELIDSDFNLQPIGSGPYRFERLLVGDDQAVPGGAGTDEGNSEGASPAETSPEIRGVVLESFDDYYLEAAFIEQFVFRYYPDSGTALSAYLEGEVLGISRVNTNVLSVALNSSELNLYSSQLPMLKILFLNLDDPDVPFFQDISVRRALMMGLDRQRMIDTLLDGQATLAYGPIFPGSWAYFDGIEHLEYDPDTAVSLLRQAGFSIPAEGGSARVNEEGQALSFELLYPEDPQYAPIAEAIAGDWGKIGISVELRAVPYQELVNDYLEPRSYQAALVDLDLAKSPDPDPYSFWHQAQITGGQNFGKWDDRQASEYLEQARIELDRAERTRLYHNFQVRFATELPALPLFYPVYNYAIDNTVQGVTVGPLYSTSDRFASVGEWFLVAERAGEVETTLEAVTPTP
jgi:peptide/nickel transport system substrate-binding protein